MMVSMSYMMTEKNGRVVKFNDSDLIGIPYRFVIGKGASEGYIEFKHRQTGEQKDVKISELTQFIEQLRENE